MKVSRLEQKATIELENEEEIEALGQLIDQYMETSFENEFEYCGDHMAQKLSVHFGDSDV